MMAPNLQIQPLSWSRQRRHVLLGDLRRPLCDAGSHCQLGRGSRGLLAFFFFPLTPPVLVCLAFPLSCLRYCCCVRYLSSAVGYDAYWPSGKNERWQRSSRDFPQAGPTQIGIFFFLLLLSLLFSSLLWLPFVIVSCKKKKRVLTYDWIHLN